MKVSIACLILTIIGALIYQLAKPPKAADMGKWLFILALAFTLYYLKELLGFL